MAISPTRIVGMATGMDTDALVSQLMKAKTIPIDQMKQKQQILSWKRDQYRDMNTLISTLSDAASKLRLQSSFLQQKATSDQTSVTVTANSSAVAGNYTMRVYQLANSANMVSSSAIGVAGNPAQALNTTASTTYSINVTGSTGTAKIDIAPGKSINDIVSSINQQTSVTGVTASYDSATDRMYLNSTGIGSNSYISVTGVDAASSTFLSSTLKLATQNDNKVTGTPVAAITSTTSPINASLSGTETFSINGVNFSIDKTTTIANLQDQLSKAFTATPVTLTRGTDGSLSLESQSAITLADVSGTGLADLGLTAGTTNSNSNVAAVTVGTDAKVDFNGVNGILMHTNNFTLNNIQFKLTTPPPAGNTSYDVHVQVQQDTDAIYNNIKSFVDAYNNVLDKVNAKISEQRFRDYPPLTDDQKTAMKDTEITEWNAKAQSGLLANDTSLEGALSDFRNQMMNPLDPSQISAGQYSMLSDIGISTADSGNSKAYQEKGKLYIDDAKLKAAIQNNPDQVMKLFTNTGTVPAGTPAGMVNKVTNNTQGFAERLYRAANNAIDNLKSVAGIPGASTDQSSLSLQIKSLSNSITDASSKLSDYEQKYYSMFAKLESAMNDANSQKSWLASMTGGGGMG